MANMEKLAGISEHKILIQSRETQKLKIQRVEI